MNDYIAWGVLGIVWFFGFAPLLFSGGWESYPESVLNGIKATTSMIVVIGIVILVSASIGHLIGEGK